MAEIKNLLVYTTYEEMINTTPRPEHGQYCQVGEKFYQYLEEDEFDRALNDWVPIYPETVQIILPKDDYTTPSQVEGLISDSKNNITELYKSADAGVLEAAKSYVDGRFVDNNEKISSIETSIKTLSETDNSIKIEFENECKGLWDAITALQDKLSEEEKVDLVNELKPELDKIYRSIENSYDIDGTKNEIARQIKETTDVMWAQINDKYTSEEECVAIYKELLKDLNTDIDSKISDKASIDYVQSVKSDVDALKTSKVNVSDIHKVAISGSYDDLSDKPIIPESVTEETIEGWGFTKNSGTVDSIKLNGETLTSVDGTIDLGTVIVETPEVTELSEQVKELESKVNNLTPNEGENYVTNSELEGKLNAINDSLDDKVSVNVYNTQITSILDKQQATDNNLNAYKSEVEKIYSTKEELENAIEPLATKKQVAAYVEKETDEAIGKIVKIIDGTSEAITADLNTVKGDLAAVKQDISDNYTTKVDTDVISSQIKDIQEKQSVFEKDIYGWDEKVETGTDEETGEPIIEIKHHNSIDEKINEKINEVDSKLDESIDSLDKKIDQVKVDILLEPNIYIPSKDIKDEAVISIDVPYYKGMSRKDIADASGVLYTEMFDNILFAKVNPQIVEPSVKMIYAENNTYFTENEINGNVEILREVNTEAPDESKFGFIADKGKVIYADKETPYTGEPVTNQNPEGVANISNLICIVNGVESESEPISVVLGTQEYKYRVYFHNGPEVTDNYGEPITSLWWDNKKYVDSSNSIKVYGTKSWYASTEKTEDDSLTKQPLVKWNESGNQTVYAKLLPSCIMAQTFRIPGELKNLYIKNGGSYTLVPLVKYKPVEINGDYYTYTYDHETYGHRGAIEIKVEF